MKCCFNGQKRDSSFRAANKSKNYQTGGVTRGCEVFLKGPRCEISKATKRDFR